MARFRKKLFKKQDPDFKTEEIKTFERKQPESVIVEESNSIDKSLSIKSLIKSGTKYAYIIAAAAFLAGIFTPFTLGLELNSVILGMCGTIFHDHIISLNFSDCIYTQDWLTTCPKTQKITILQFRNF